MRCQIADLITEVPDAGGLAPRCEAYLYEGKEPTDIEISAEEYRKQKYPASFSPEDVAYMDSGRQFYSKLLEYDGFYLHSSALVAEGRAYLFSGYSGVGKSTHAALWKQLPGVEVIVINDDKPALRRLGDRWIAYGTPWCGKDGINCNIKAPLAGICFLKQGEKNEIRRISAREAMPMILSQTIWKLRDPKRLDKLLHLLDQLLAEIPVYELENLPEPAAAMLSYETMRKGAEEVEV